jgi:tetratricopeptide (TPR) repeat protein
MPLSPPNQALVYNHRGMAYFSRGDFPQALHLAPVNNEGYFGRAQRFYEIQLFTQVLADREKTLAIQPDFSPARQLQQLIHRGAFR